jgi:hypothetical protein
VRVEYRKGRKEVEVRGRRGGRSRYIYMKATGGATSREEKNVEDQHEDEGKNG